MFATDFLFDSQRASDFGLMICSFNGDFETASGGEIEYNVAKTPNRDRFTFYGAQLNSVITWNFSICKNPCQNQDLYFNQYEESSIAKWLLKINGYGKLQFDQEGYEDITYNAYFNMAAHQINGKTVGFDLTATTDCAYGFTDTIKKTAIINTSTPLKMNVHNDINSYIFPCVKIKRKSGTGDFYIKNGSDKQNKQTEFINMQNAAFEIIMDSDSDTISGLHDPNKFNWCFLRLIDGCNIIQTNSEYDLEIEIYYKEVRRVIV